MVQHAFSTGRVVPIEVMVRRDQAVSTADGLSVVVAPASFLPRGLLPVVAAAAAGAAVANDEGYWHPCSQLSPRVG